MKEPKRTPTKTRNHLLKAAVDVFASAGIAGATTREIALQAGVNELTLFRHFQSKEQLLKAVVHHITALQAETLNNQVEWTQDLRIDLLHYAKIYSNHLDQYEALVRMFIGEAKRHPEEALRITQEATLPLREKLITYLRSGVDKGTVHPDVDLAMAIDQLTGMLLAGMLRRQIALIPLDYNREQYIEGCVDLFVKGISPLLASTEQIKSPSQVRRKSKK